MKTVFERLERISDEYRNTVDELSENYELDGRRDYLFSDAVQAEKVAERNTAFNSRIDAAATKAMKDAAPLIDELRATLKTYITTSANPTTLATLQSLVAGGVELSDAEIAAFADGADYPTLRLLERPSKGHIQAPKPERMEADLKELEAYFRNIRAYRGGLAGATTETFWGRSATVGNVIQKGMIEGFPQKVDEIEGRWTSTIGGNVQ